MKKRIALVTGGVGDIGTTICQALSKQGFKVIAADRIEHHHELEWQAQQKKLGFDFGVVQVDATNFQSCETMAAEVQKKYGPIDVLINAAGTINDCTFRKMTEAQWTSVVHTDLDSMFYITRQFINSMIERQYGRIVNISSVNAQKGQFGQTNYSSAKSGIYGFTKSLALEVGKYGITVNAISPGLVKSRMVSSIPNNICKELITQIPVGRLANPEEIAWAISFLVAEESGYITGINLPVNGGLHLY